MRRRSAFNPRDPCCTNRQDEPIQYTCLLDVNYPMNLLRLALFLNVLLALLGTSGDDLQTYKEPYRPQFHFTPEKNWMNDPNGMVVYEGEYHLFYQYNPSGDKWGHMSWGHAVSPDMVRWQHLPLALPEEDGVMIFSGSAVVDWKNTSDFGTNGRPALVDFQLASSHRLGSRVQISRAREVLRHVEKHRRRYLRDGRGPRGSEFVLADLPPLRRSFTALVWRRTIKPIYVFVTRKLLSTRDGEARRRSDGSWPRWTPARGPRPSQRMSSR